MKEKDKRKLSIEEQIADLKEKILSLIYILKRRQKSFYDITIIFLNLSHMLIIMINIVKLN